MPNRYVREAAIRSQAVNALSWQAEVFWRRLLNRVDDFGRYPADASLLRADLFPRQLEMVREKDVLRLLAECEAVGLVFTYQDSGKPFLVMNQWEQGRAKQSLWPAPPVEVCQRMQTYVYACKHASTYVPDPDPDPDPVSDNDLLIVNEIYEAYPRRVGKPKAIQAISKAIARGIEAAALLAITKQYAAAVKGKDIEFIPHPTTWFNQERYNDLPATWSTNASQGPKLSSRVVGTANEAHAHDYDNYPKL